MKCKHDKISRLVEQDGMVADGFCPICLHEQLALAVKVVEAAERYKHHAEFYFPVLKNPDCNSVSENLRDAISKFKGGQDDNS